MTSKILITKTVIAVIKSIAASVLCLAISTQAIAQEKKEKHSPIHIGLIYPLSTNGINAAEYNNTVSLHAIAGVSNNESAVCLSGFANFIKNDADGVVGSGFANAILGDAKGAQLAGFINVVGGDAKGVQAGGFMSFSGYTKGAQLGGFSTLTRKHVDGAQIAGFMNIARTVKGAQAAGFMNVSSDVQGVQLAGFMNVAKDVNTQAAPFMNIAKNVKGVQLSSFINIADSSDYPIGIINIIKKGDMAIGLTVDNNLTNMVALRSGGRVLYGILGVGANYKDYNNEVFAMEIGLGAHLNLSKHFRINVEGTIGSLTDFYEEAEFTSSIRILPSLRFGLVEIFGGPTFNYFALPDHYNKSVVDRYAWGSNDVGFFQGFYFGALGGVQFHF